jgi:hypothetical protein
VSRRALIASMGAVALLACAPMLANIGPVSGATISSLDGTPTRVDLLARQFLPARTPPDPGFANYCYLVFTDRAKATAVARKVAASAFLDLFSDVVEASQTVSREHMAGRCETVARRRAS